MYELALTPTAKALTSIGAVSGLFAYAVSFADGATLYGWQVLFIVEGLLTVTLGIGMYFILPDWPSVRLPFPFAHCMNTADCI